MQKFASEARPALRIKVCVLALHAAQITIASGRVQTSDFANKSHVLQSGISWTQSSNNSRSACEGGIMRIANALASKKPEFQRNFDRAKSLSSLRARLRMSE